MLIEMKQEGDERSRVGGEIRKLLWVMWKDLT